MHDGMKRTERRNDRNRETGTGSRGSMNCHLRRLRMSSAQRGLAGLSAGALAKAEGVTRHFGVSESADYAECIIGRALARPVG
jgi:hypothetical protein